MYLSIVTRRRKREKERKRKEDEGRRAHVSNFTYLVWPRGNGGVKLYYASYLRVTLAQKWGATFLTENENFSP